MSIHVLKLLHAATPDAADADLLKRFATARDEAAFAELVRRHGPAVYRVSRRLAPACADDAFQATFLVLACRAKAVRKAASVGSWLIGVAGRVSRQMARREARRQGTGDRGQQDPAAGDLLSPVSCLLSAELSAILDDELTRLPDRYRAPVVLCLVNGRTQEQAAAELGGSVRTLRRRLDQAKALLRLRLERRGVVPAVAVGLVASVGKASAVPAELGRAAVRGVYEFLNGGAALSPAAVVAKGVVGSMANVKTTALVATAAAVMIGLGIGMAQQPPTPTPPELPRPMPLKVPALGEKPVTLDLVLPDPALPQNRLETSSVHRSSNFEVTAPTALIARAVAAEAEFQRTELAKLWLGVPQATWEPRCKIEVKIGTTRVVGATTFDFGEKAGKPSCRGARMTLEGTFMSVLSNTLPHEVTHAVMAYHFGKPLPRWADEGIAVLSESREEQAAHDVRSRELLNVGRGIRLRVLFRMTEYPRDMMVLYAQGHSVARFLAWQEWSGIRKYYDPKAGKFFGDDASRPLHEIYTWYGHFLGFLKTGMDGNTPESWDKAAKEMYGFDSVDALEEAWLEWLAKPASQFNPPPKPSKPKEDGSGLIPPTKLPGGSQPPAAKAAPSQDAMFVNARKVKLPITRAADPRTESVYLFVSRDKGSAWARQAVLAADESSFILDAPADGEYWFAVDTQPRLKAEDLTPALKVVVDTKPPAVNLTAAKRVGGKLSVTWTATDANPLGTPVVQYRPEVGNNPWSDHVAAAGATTATFEPKVKGPFIVRVVVKDAAGNEGTSGTEGVR